MSVSYSISMIQQCRMIYYDTDDFYDTHAISYYAYDIDGYDINFMLYDTNIDGCIAVSYDILIYCCTV